MSDTSSRILRTLGDLALALINATLILIAICLFLGLRLTQRVDTIATHAAAEFAQGVARVDPLRSEVEGLSGEVAGLRADLASVRAQTGDMTSEAAQALAERIAAFEQRMDQVGERLEGMQERIRSADIDPEALLTHTIRTAAAEMTASFGQLAGCDMSALEMPGRLTPPANDAGGQ